MGILEQLDKPDFRPSKSDRLLIAYIRENAETVACTPIAKLAEAAGVGEATITRFVKKMGHANLQAFKVQLTEELTEGSRRYIINSSIEPEETSLLTGRKLLDANIGTLEKTLEALPPGRVERCAAMIEASKRIFFFGLGNSGFSAMDSSYKFSRIGFESRGLDNSHHMMVAASLLTKNDIVVAISHSGNSPEILSAVHLARQNGAQVIVITANHEIPLAELANAVLLYEAQESLLETGSISAKLAQFFILDLIYTQVVKDMPEMAAKNKEKTTRAMALLHR